jgi:hypothetical protein
MYHWFSGTTGTFSPYKARCVERNHIVTAVRHLPFRDVILLPVWTAARWVALAQVARTRDAETDAGAFPLAWGVIRGTFAGLVALPAAVRDRWRLRQALPVDAQSWRRRLSEARCELEAFRRFGA